MDLFNSIAGNGGNNSLLVTGTGCSVQLCPRKDLDQRGFIQSSKNSKVKHDGAHDYVAYLSQESRGRTG